jgi:hypothetical protein
MALTDDQFRERMSATAARSCWETRQAAGVIGRWTPARTAATAAWPEGRLAILGQMAGLDVRITVVGDRFVVGQKITSGGRPAVVWDFVSSAATLEQAHAAAWRILAPRDKADGVLAQLAAEGVPMAPGWRS